MNWIRDAFGHLKVIAYTAVAQPLIDEAGIDIDEGVIQLIDNDFSEFIVQAKKHRIWKREPTLRSF